MFNLNLGSFMDVVLEPDWLNIDKLPLACHMPPGVRFMQHDLTEGIPFATQSIDLIRASHVLEHVPLEDGHFMLGEIYRVLRNSGMVRIAVPDTMILVSRYMEGKMEDFIPIQPDEFREASTQGEKFSRLMFSGDNDHKATYDFAMLRDFLVQAGFDRRHIERCPPGYCKAVEILKAYQDQHVELSLYVEAVK